MQRSHGSHYRPTPANALSTQRAEERHRMAKQLIATTDALIRAIGTPIVAREMQMLGSKSSSEMQSVPPTDDGDVQL